jgi:hypothetical protein
VVSEYLHDAGRALQPRPRPDEDALRARRDEVVDEVLREREVDLLRPVGRALASVAAREVDVDVEPVLVGDVLRAERSSLR